MQGRMLLSGLFLSTIALLPACVLGAQDEAEKMGNRTIERVSALVYVTNASMGCGQLFRKGLKGAWKCA